jgi:hypothetical protein
MRALALIAALLVASPAIASGRVSDGKEHQTSIITFEFDDTVPSGIFPMQARGCSNLRAIFVPGGPGATGVVQLHSLPEPDALVTGETLIQEFGPTQTGEPGTELSATGDRFVFDVKVAETVGTSRLIVRCSNYFSNAFGPPPAPTADAVVTTTPPGTDPGQYSLDATGSSCRGNCTYAWTETTGGGALCTAITDATARFTTAEPCSEGTSTFQVVVTNVTGSDSASDSDTIGAAPSGFPFNFPQTFSQ